MKNIEIEYKVMVDKQDFIKLEEFLDNHYKYKTYIQNKQKVFCIFFVHLKYCCLLLDYLLYNQQHIHYNYLS